MNKILLVALGGGLGALLRLAAYEWAARAGRSPLGATLAVNLLGAAAIGAFMGLHLAQGRFSNEARLFFVTGFLGALTTFSAFSWDLFKLFQDGKAGLALGYAAANNLGCLVLAWAGWRMTV